MCALRIVVDDGCDVPDDLVEKHRMRVIPLVVRFGDEVFDDGRMTRDEYWARKDRSSSHPQTSQPASGTFLKVFQDLVQGGDDVLCVVITSKHSGTFNSAWLAAQQFPGRVTVYDSLFVSWGSGWLAVRAAELAEAGESLPAILQHLDTFRSAMLFPILLDTIEDIRRGGRADRLIPVVEKVMQVFNIKPLITFIDGELKMIGTVRSYEKGLSRLLDMMAEKAPYEKLAVFHTRQQQAAEEFADRLAERVGYPRDQMYVTETGPVLATHAGPKAMAAIGLPAGV